MPAIVSRDGTAIAFHRRGSGPPLVLVAGAGAANPLAWPATARLEQHFTVYAVDRRGRGGSSDGVDYAIEREADDIAAVVDSLGEPANVLGHSFGGLVVLEAALRTPNMRRLILYEPWFAGPGEIVYADGFLERLEQLLEEGDHEGLLVTHYREDVGMTPEEIAWLKDSPAWPERLAAAPTVPRELRAATEYLFDAGRFKDLATPVLYLLGSDSTQFIRFADFTCQRLPDCRVAVMSGQQHFAMYTVPELFVAEVLAFVTD